MDTEKKKRCFNCKFFATQDEGYSNWTVENTIVHCLKKLNPHFPMDESYSWTHAHSETKNHDVVKVAEACPAYKEAADQIHLDVDGDTSIEDYKADPELYEAARIYFGN